MAGSRLRDTCSSRRMCHACIKPRELARRLQRLAPRAPGACSAKTRKRGAHQHKRARCGNARGRGCHRITHAAREVRVTYCDWVSAERAGRVLALRLTHKSCAAHGLEATDEDHAHKVVPRKIVCNTTEMGA